MTKVSSSRSIVRRRMLEKQALDNVVSEVGGSLLAPVTGLAGGASLGAIIAAIAAAAKGKHVGRSALAGASAGALAGYSGAHLANVGGALVGALRRRRTKKEQQEHDSKSHWSNFIPGVGSYNYTKRIGRVLAGVGEPDSAKKAASAIRKQAQIDPARIAGTLAMLGGGALGGSAATGDDQSTLKRIGKGTLGTGLAVAGYKAMTDPVWQRMIRRGVYNAKDYLSRLVGGLGPLKKAGSAYIDGFVKAAETAGVDPVALYKAAAPAGLGFVGNLLGRGLRMARGAVSAGKAAGGRYVDLMRGKTLSTLQNRASNFRSMAGRYNLDAMTAPSDAMAARAKSVAHRAMHQAGRAEGMAANEQRLVNRARYGTAGGVAGGLALMGMAGGGDNETPPQPTNPYQQYGHDFAGMYAG